MRGKITFNFASQYENVRDVCINLKLCSVYTDIKIFVVGNYMKFFDRIQSYLRQHKYSIMLLVEKERYIYVNTSDLCFRTINSLELVRNTMSKNNKGKHTR